MLDDDVAVEELIAQTEELINVINQIHRARSENFFKFLSKQTRNALLQGLLEKSGAVEDAAKATVRALKKGSKRERLPEEIADMLLLGQRQAASACVPTVTGKPTETAADAE